MNTRVGLFYLTVITSSRTIEEEVGLVVNKFKTSGNEGICRLLKVIIISKDSGTFGILLRKWLIVPNAHQAQRRQESVDALAAGEDLINDEDLDDNEEMAEAPVRVPQRRILN